MMSHDNSKLLCLLLFQRRRFASTFKSSQAVKVNQEQQGEEKKQQLRQANESESDEDKRKREARITSLATSQAPAARASQANSYTMALNSRSSNSSTCSTSHRLTPQTMNNKKGSDRCNISNLDTTRQAHREPAQLVRFGALAVAALLIVALAASAASAEDAATGNETGGYGAGQQQVNEYDLGQSQQQQQQGSAKAKKIQIVYIKVPLAKLKPSLAAGDYNQGGQQASAASPASSSGADNATYAAEQTKAQGSQSADQQQQIDESQLDGPQSRQQQQSSFLIPMAVIQADSSSGSADGQPQPQQQQQFGEQQSSLQAPSSTNKAFSSQQPAPAGSYLAASHALPSLQQQLLTSGSFYEQQFAFEPARGPQFRRSRQQQLQPQQLFYSPAQLYHQQQLMSSPSVSHGINHGFMSSFLQAEKEKLTQAALRMSTGQQLDAVATAAATANAASSPAAPSTAAAGSSSPASASASAPSSSSSAASSSSGSTSSPSPVAPSNVQPSAQSSMAAQTAQQHTGQKQQYKQQGHQQGGLMPMMMMPLSMMPDNMIGQAYNAAVGQALPVESGSPSNILGTQTVAHNAESNGSNNNDNYGKRGNNNNNYGGGNAGTHGDAATSLGTASSGSYGSNGPNQLDNTSSGNGYQHSGSGFAASGLSSGYGSGINSFGASVAFSDYPIGPSTASGPQGYGAQQQHSSSSSSTSSSSNSNSNSNSNHHLSPSAGSADSAYSGAGQAADSHYGAGGQKLRQAKKTIIPIVVQVEHAIMEANAAALGSNYGQPGGLKQQQQQQGNRYGAGVRGHRQLGGKRGNRGHKAAQLDQQSYRSPAGGNVPYGAATNDITFGASGAQYINAANAQDINQITAQINAENAASAAAALAQADMAFGSGAPAYIGNQGMQPNRQPNHHQMALQGQQQVRPSSQYLQSAASALLANTHPVLQAAASGGLASVSKLGAKLGEIIALPSMPMSSALPSALSSISNQMGLQLGQAVQQAAKEHPVAHAFARQVAQHAGLNLPNFSGQQQQGAQPPQQHPQHQVAQAGLQQQVAASNQHVVQQALSPQAQLQNLKLSIGQNLQTAAAQLMGVHQKGNAAQSAANTLLANPLAALYPQSVNAALKQLSAGAPGAQQQAQASFGPSGQVDPHHAQSSSLVPVQQQLSGQQQALFQQQQQFQQQQAQQQLSPNSAIKAGGSDAHSALLGLGDSPAGGQVAPVGAAKPSKSSTLKSKFLSFFQPPKFISNLLSWNDRADERQDVSGEPIDLSSADAQQASAAIASPTMTSSNSSQVEASKQQRQQPQQALKEMVKVNSTVQQDQQLTSKAAPLVTVHGASSASNSSVPAATPAKEQAKFAYSPPEPSVANSTSNNSTTSAVSGTNQPKKE